MDLGCRSGACAFCGVYVTLRVRQKGEAQISVFYPGQREGSILTLQLRPPIAVAAFMGEARLGSTTGTAWGFRNAGTPLQVFSFLHAFATLLTVTIEYYLSA